MKCLECGKLNCFQFWKNPCFPPPAGLEDIPIAGLKDAAFRHYSGPVGKPTYEMKLRQGSNQMVNG